jgi:hypothetical protein
MSFASDMFLTMCKRTWNERAGVVSCCSVVGGEKERVKLLLLLLNKFSK